MYHRSTNRSLVRALTALLIKKSLAFSFHSARLCTFLSPNLLTLRFSSANSRSLRGASEWNPLALERGGPSFRTIAQFPRLFEKKKKAQRRRYLLLRR